MVEMEMLLPLSMQVVIGESIDYNGRRGYVQIIPVTDSIKWIMLCARLGRAFWYQEVSV